MADISKININDTDYNIKDATARNDISNLTDIERSASGTIVSFNDGGDNIPVKSLIANITAVQAGTGDPSPSNIRPISGFDSIEIVRSGTNIWNEQWEVGTINDTTGLPVSSTTQIRSKNFCSCKGDTTYYICVGTNNDIRVCWYDKNQNYISQTGNISNATATSPVNAFFFKIRSTNAYGAEYKNDIGINYPSTATTYEQYKGRTYTIALGPNTVYDGTLDVTKGILTVTHQIIDLGDFTWYYSTTQVRFYTSIGETDIFPHAVGTIADLVCDSYNNVPFLSVTSDTTLNNVIAGTYTTLDYITVRDTRYERSVDFQAAAVGIKAKIPLATPLVINLNKTQVTTLLNENNIYVDSGDISVEYFTQSAKNMLNVADSSNKMDLSNPTGTGSLSIGREPGTIIGARSASIGYANTASGNYAFAEGQRTISSGQGSHSEGRETQATANYAHAEGYKCIASGQRSHAEGTDTIASGSYSHAEGNATKATTNQAHAEGYKSEANGNSSHAEGYISKSNGDYSHAEGDGTIAKNKSQHVFGAYNTEDPSPLGATSKGTYIEIVGNGTDNNARSNARTLDWDGNETLAGDLTINGSTSVGTTLSNKVDIPSIDITNQTLDLLTLVQNLGANGTHYARWICKSDAGSANISNKPTTVYAGFVCIAYCTRWVTASDYIYALECWVRNIKIPYVAIVAQNYTSITWYQEVTGSGTSGYLAKFTDSNHVSNGPLLGSDTTKFLRNDGTWQVPVDSKKIDLWNDSLAEYRRCVIALCRVSTTNSTSLNSWSSGTISMHRTNGLHGVFNIEYSIENQYTSAYAANVFSAYSDIDNVPSPTLPKGVSWSWCSFKHDDVWYAGIEYFVADARFDNVMLDYVGNFEPFAFAWYDTKNSVVLDSEFNSSVSYTAPEHKRNEYFNEQVVVRRPIKPVITGTGTPGEDKGSGVSPRYFPAKWTFDTGYAATTGTVVTIQLPVAGHDNGIYMTIDNGAHYYPVTTASTNRLTGHFAVNTFVSLIFDEAGSAGSMIPLDGGNSRVTVTGGVWRVLNYYDSGNNRVRQTLATDNTDRPLLLSYANNTTTTANVDNVSYRCNNIFANPSTGDLSIGGDLTINGNTSVANAIRNLHIASSVSGPVASFTDGSDKIPLKSFTIPIVATQSGSGTPSPTNVRPINGVDTVVVSHMGKNWFERSTVTRDKAIVWTTGEPTNETGSWVSDFIFVKPNETYIASDSLSQLFAYDSTKTAVYVWKGEWISVGTTGTTCGIAFTIPEGISYIRFVRRNVGDIDADIENFQLERGTSRTAFEYYKGNIYTTQIGQTVYYGTYNVMSGSVQVDKVCVTLDPSATWVKNAAITASNAFTASAFFDNYRQENGLCSHFGTVNSVSATEGIYFGSNINIFTPLSLGLNTVEKFTQWITGKNIQVLYTLDIPYVIVLPEQQKISINTKLGINNICSDVNDVSITYFNQNADPLADLIKVLTQ